MMVGMLVAGFGLVLAGLLAIGYGVQYKEFSVGSTLILSGVFAVCTGALMFGFWLTVRELRSLSRRLGAAASDEQHSERPVASAAAGGSRSAGGPEPGFSFNRDRTAGPGEPAPAGGQPPWYHEAAARDRARGDMPPVTSPAAESEEAAAPRRRNLLFSSTRKDRARASEPLSPDLLAQQDHQNPPAGPAPTPDSDAPQPPAFDDTWPRSERPRASEPPPRRMPRAAPAAPGESPPGAAPATDRRPPKPQEQPPVTVLKSGVVDGMAYSLYSDGSIEAQMPEGMMRFGSIDELRAHLEQRS